MVRLLYAALFWCLVILPMPRPASAQTAAESAAGEARLQVGPFAFTPRFSLRDVGVDSNVYHSADEPQRDFTFTAGPGLDTWMRVGRLWITSVSELEWVHFNQSSEQRSFNVRQNLRFDVNLMHLVPHAEAGYRRSRRQLNLELDGRLEETQTHAGVGVEFRPGPRTSIDVAGVKRRLRYGVETFGGAPLAERLNRESVEGSVGLRYALTPLTTLLVEAGLQQDRFEFDPVRDSDSVSLVPGFEFKPFALISGSAKVGFRRFETRDESVPDFAGVVAEVDVSYTLRDRVRFTVRATRDVEYRIEPAEPFFVNAGLGFEVIRVVGLNWDVVVRGDRTTLAYQATEGGQVLGRVDRVDRVYRYGAGFGRHVGENIRLGFDVNHVERQSDVPGRAYAGWRTGGSLTYGF